MKQEPQHTHIDFAEKLFNNFSQQVCEGSEYLQIWHTFAWPNFVFHLSMVCASDRAKGVPLSKGDYDGIHGYPLGFSFEGKD